MKAASLRLQLSLWLLVPLLTLLALDAWLTDRRATAAAHQAFDRTLDASLKAMREGVSLRDGRIEVELPYLALEVFESESGSRIYYRVRDEHGETVTGYDALPMPPGSDHPLYQTVFYDAEFRGEPLRMAAITLPLHDVGSARARLVWLLVAETIEPREQLAHEILIGSLLQELLGNLLDNAIRYAGPHAEVTVRVGQGTTHAGDGAWLQVVDNGPGIDAGERERVFSRFYRGESGTARPGSGLGLSIVREIARLHRAHVDLAPTAGGGLTVTVLFPPGHGCADARD
ncbi:hypothetical protein BKK79_18145 [Cupriavidus sp. USMAA2-4]|uniref:sensor histidine kinase N-terminal domain-containing protein n=1 Tax=Cupriavidus sp. USMAA2-4 TaxID=876364 RepID=UPI0008A6E617|nr:sensor histidine kinase N-terminal domain-containing protein [Cupriavidus sp. USMAA2-4]AOY93503.1 hypothetical protein BKK79_18145 [Cupriavidus sp. USMAA2-4]